MKNRITWLIILLIFWITGASYVYVCIIKDHCGGGDNNENRAAQREMLSPPKSQPGISDADTAAEPARTEPNPAETAYDFLDSAGTQYFRFDFASSEARIPSGFNKYIENLKIYLGSDPGNKVYVTGHADPRGSREANMRFSRERADFIAGYLISNGVDKSQTVVAARGASDPVASNETEAGRSKNRRVEVKIQK
jgi:OOP family OmpA-OmpF porin